MVCSEEEDTFISRGDGDIMIKRVARLIAAAVFLAVFPEFDFAEIRDML